MTTYLFQDQRRVLPSWLSWKKRLFLGALGDGLPCIAIPHQQPVLWLQPFGTGVAVEQTVALLQPLNTATADGQPLFCYNQLSLI